MQESRYARTIVAFSDLDVTRKMPKALQSILAHFLAPRQGPKPASRGLAFAGTGARRTGICTRRLIEDQITARKASATFPPAIRTAATAVCPASIVCVRAVLRRVPLCSTATV